MLIPMNESTGVFNVIVCEREKKADTVLGFLMGTLWVTFCHTIPIPMYTVPIMGTGTTQPVITVGSHETHGVGGTNGFFIRGSKMVYQNYKIPVLNKLLNVLNL